MSRYIIQCWPWEAAPPELQQLCIEPGKQDWVAVVPTSLLKTYQDHPLMGQCLNGSRVSQYQHPTDASFQVFIGTQDEACALPDEER